MKRIIKWVYPKIDEYDPKILPVDNKPRCPKCGLELDKIMMYYCTQTDCPTGLGSTSSLEYYGA